MVHGPEVQSGQLQALAAQAAANGVDDMRWLSAAEAESLEPALSCFQALLSPSTGIIDSHGFMLALQGDAENAGAVFAFHSPVVAGRTASEGVELDVGGAEPMTLACNLLVNSAGLHAPALVRAIAAMPAELIPTAYYAKGNYFTLAGRSPFSTVPIPSSGSASSGSARRSASPP